MKGRSSKAIEIRDTNTGTVFLHPDVRTNLAAKLLVDTAWVFGLGDLERHGTLHEQLLFHRTLLYVDRDAEIEAAREPLLGRVYGYGILARQAQVKAGQRGYRVALAPELRCKGPFGVQLLMPLDHVVRLV